MRILLALAALFLLTTYAPRSLFRPLEPAARPLLFFEAVPLDHEDESRRRLGPLTYLGGWAVRSNDPRFGGISAMHVDEGEVAALSDAGALIRFQLPSAGRVVPVRIQPLPHGPGGNDTKRSRDSEAMAVHGGQAWISFERQNAIWRYSTASWRSDAAFRPPGMKKWPTNAGSEAIVRLDDGRFLIFSEGAARTDGTSAAILFDADPALPGTGWRALGYRAPPGFRVTDAALLPDGRLLILNRRFSLLEGMSALLTVAATDDLATGEMIEGEEIASLRSPVTVDNMEALSVTREAGRTIVWIASDDNFNPLQRTLLLKFALDDPRFRGARP